MAKSSLCRVGGMLSMFILAAALATSAQTVLTMVNFDSNNGQNPYASLIQAHDGNFYGTTYAGGNNNMGTVFTLTPWGTMTVLFHFTNFCSGAHPYAPLLQASDGNFYGTASQGGSSAIGTVFKITPHGTMTCLHSFSGGDGANPMGALIEGSDGALYGTTAAGGNPVPSNGAPSRSGQTSPFTLAQGAGTVFKITTTGTFTTVYSFCSLPLCNDGVNPLTALVQGSDGKLYGTTHSGGPGAEGVVFQLATDGSSFAVLHGFGGGDDDGAAPAAPLIFGHDGTLYGTTESGGPDDDGVIFNVSIAGVFTQLFSFDGSGGASPDAGLLLASDGNLYGTTSQGGGNDAGTIFRISAAGTNFELLYTFGSVYGMNPRAALIQAVNGSFYGTAGGGGTLAMGTIFNMGPMPQQFVAVSPCRLVDSRTDHTPLDGGVARTFDLRTLALINNCASLVQANSYALNVTLVPHDGPVSFVTLWPAGSTMPTASTMNSYNGQVKANAAIVPGGVAGAISVYATDTTDIILDLSGYFTEAAGLPTLQVAQTLQFYPMAPCRVVDTRGSDGAFGGPHLTGNVPRQFPIMTSTCFAGADPPSAYSFNVTVVPHQLNQPLAYLTLWPSGEDQPNVSTLNNPLGTAVANAAIVPAGTGADGAIRVYAYNDTDLIIDVNGYFAAPGRGGLSFYPGMPCRSIDTRASSGPFAGPIIAKVMETVCTPPVSPGAFVANTTVVPNGSLGYLTLWPDGTDLPVVSTLNSYNGIVTSNLAIVPNLDGSIDAFAAGSTNLVLDLSGYFAAAPID